MLGFIVWHEEIVVYHWTCFADEEAALPYLSEAVRVAKYRAVVVVARNCGLVKPSRSCAMRGFSS